jgi:hypothetical protein
MVAKQKTIFQKVKIQWLSGYIKTYDPKLV